MVRGSCLCGGIVFEVAEFTGPFELCHCSRCRKVTGSAYMAGVVAPRAGFQMVQGADLIVTYDAPLRDRSPPYRVCFCSRCGSPLPDPSGDSPWIEVPAGLLDESPGVLPDKHIFIEKKALWDRITDGLPQLDEAALRVYRAKAR